MTLTAIAVLKETGADIDAQYLRIFFVTVKLM